jgi:acylphosphatase
MKRAHVFYSGHVQGIGFRYTSKDIAMRLGLKGWVKNLEDGRVEIIAEGKEKDINGFLDNISKSQLARYIKNTELSWDSPTGEFNGFDINF